MTSPRKSRRDRAWHTLETELGAPVGRTSDLGGIWGAALDAYEGEIADDLENVKLIDDVAQTIRVLNPEGAARTAEVAIGAIRAALEVDYGG
jgi:hypothetical protein